MTGKFVRQTVTLCGECINYVQIVMEGECEFHSSNTPPNPDPSHCQSSKISNYYIEM